MVCDTSSLARQSSVYTWVALVLVAIFVIAVTLAVAFYDSYELKQPNPNELPKSVIDIVQNSMPTYETNAKVQFNTNIRVSRNDGIPYLQFSPASNSVPSQVRLVTSETKDSSGVYGIREGLYQADVNLSVSSAKNVKTLSVALVPVQNPQLKLGSSADTRNKSVVLIDMTKINVYGDVLNKLFPVRLTYVVNSKAVASSGLAVVIEEVEVVDITKSTFVEIEGLTSSVLLKFMTNAGYNSYYKSYDLVTDTSHLGPKDLAIAMLNKKYGMTFVP